MGPDHPGWNDPRGIDEPPSFDPSSGPSHLPPGSVPPGARFDPIVPERTRLKFPGKPGSRRPPLRYDLANCCLPRVGMSQSTLETCSFLFSMDSGEPDNDELPPPGSRDSFL
jgi:proteasome inhibitor subunit 1 (PI31)